MIRHILNFILTLLLVFPVQGMDSAEFVFNQISDEEAAARVGASVVDRTPDSTPVSELDPRIIGDNPGSTLGELRQNVMIAAGEQWSRFLMSDIPIEVEFGCVDYGGQVNGGIALAGAAPTYLISSNQGIQNAPQDDVAYPIALVNSFEGMDVVPGDVDIEVFINSNRDLEGGSLFWFYGLNNETLPSGAVSLIDTITHELAHGLGFASFVNLTNGSNVLEVPDIFSAIIYDVTQEKSWKEMTNQERLQSARNNGNVVWNGIHANAAASGVNDYLSSGVAQINRYAALPAVYGPSLPNEGLAGEVILALDGVEGDGTISDAAQELINPDELTGKIALIDRGINHFELKTLRAQNAGATGVIIANNVPGGGLLNPAGSEMAEEESTIPTIFVTYETGVLLKNILVNEPSLQVKLYNERLVLDGVGSGSLNKVQLYAPPSIEIGSSISHWDTATSPDLVMEPFDTGNYTDDLDLSPLLLKDIGWNVSNVEIPYLKYFSWLSENGLSGLEVEAQLSGDFDQDGVSNLLEYVSSGDPANATDNYRGLELRTGMEVAYQRSSLLNDVEVIYESSTDLINWVPSDLEETVSKLDNETESVTVPFESSGQKDFLRLNYKIVE